MSRILAGLSAAATIFVAANAQAAVSPTLYYHASLLAPEIKALCDTVRPGSTADLDANLPTFLSKHRAEIKQGRDLAIAIHPGKTPQDVDADTLLDEMTKFYGYDEEGRTQTCRGLIALVSGNVPGA